MKKRIISLILVVAMAILTLTGCGYNYAKDDMSKYATLHYDEFYEALHKLVITEEGFGTDEDERNARVKDAVAAAILGKTDTTEKLFAGKVGEYDSLYFCYYATDEDGNIFFASKMDQSSSTQIQIDSTTFEDAGDASKDPHVTKEFINAVSSGVLSIEDIANYIYNTSAATVVGKDDILSISYTKTWKDGEKTETETKTNAYFDPSSNAALATALVGKQVGIVLDEFKVTEKFGESDTDVECTYTDFKVESIVKDNSTDKVEDGDVIYVTYTMTFDANKYFFNTETDKIELPEGFSEANLEDDGTYKAVVTFKKLTANADPEGTADDQKTFAGQLVDKNVGTVTSSITVKSETIGDKTVEVKYSNVKVNCIVNSTTEGFTVKYTPYEALDEKESNKKEETNEKGVKVLLNAKELTYHIFPVYYVDVEVSAENIIREFTSVVAKTETKEHDHTEEDHEHETEYVFDTLNDTGFVNGTKTLAALIEELKPLITALSTKETNLTNALKALNTAQSNYAKDDKKSDTKTADLKSKLVNAETAYLTAKTEADTAEKNVTDKMTEILACKKGDTGIEAGIIADYEAYHYDLLETDYNSGIRTELANQIIALLNAKVTFTGEPLPKKAVKSAYNSLMNTYKNTFYEKWYDADGDVVDETDSSAEQSIYSAHDGDFEEFLSVATTGKKGSSDSDVEAAITKEAEQTVKDIIIIYVFADAIEAKWDTEIYLTRSEKKEIKKTLGLNNSSNEAIEVYYHATQFDNIMEYLLEEKETDGKTVEFVNISYSIPEDK